MWGAHSASYLVLQVKKHAPSIAPLHNVIITIKLNILQFFVQKDHIIPYYYPYNFRNFQCSRFWLFKFQTILKDHRP